ncbi:MAG TPA: ABC transporter ATP-binding protein [Planctomycetota bacterium]
MPAIEVQGLRKRFGRGGRAVQALDGIDLEVAPGEIYGLLGRNGAGKTTLVKVLLDIVRADAGSAAILGRSSKSARARSPVGYLPEDHRFPEYRTGLGALDLYGGLSGLSARESRRRAGELLEQVGLAGAARKKIRGYSKGMKQRLGLAQALVHDPSVLFLDEPTDGVDPVGRAEIRALLEDLRDKGCTIFLNSHLLGEVEQICDRVGILEAGRMVREGGIDSLTRADRAWDLRTEPAVDAALLPQLRALVTRAELHDQTLELAAEDDADLDAALDFLRARGHRLRGLQSRRLTLEQVFLRAVEEPA